MDENKEVFEILREEGEEYNWEMYPKKHKLFSCRDGRLAFFPREGGVLVINPDGTWGGDIAPFCD